MKKSSFHILRVGTAITFLWIGILILGSPESWGFLLWPWAADLLPIPLKEAMISIAILDIAIGLILLLDVRVWIGALIGSLHLIVVLITVGITAVTVRDIGLLAATIALLLDSIPQSVSRKFFRG